MCALPAPPAAAVPHIKTERLDRGLVATTAPRGVFLSWCFIGTEVTEAGPSGRLGADFRVYRDGRLTATVTDSTNCLDPAGTPTSPFGVAPIGGHRSASISALRESFYDVSLRKPADGVTPAGEAYTYAANDMSVGDANGDGRYQLVVKWEPSNAKDVSQHGYTGPTCLDTYTLDGTLLWRLDLGVNIRSGAHYAQFLVYDFDGDGRSEVMLKTAPGTSVICYDAAGNPKQERFVTMPRPGYAHTDDYRLSAAGYFDHVVEVFTKWHKHPEVVAGRWPATLEQAFGITPMLSYPLSREAATELATHFVDVYARARSGNNRLREFAGFVIIGPEYPVRLRRRHRQRAAHHRLQARPGRRRPAVGRLSDGPHRTGQPRRPLPVLGGLPRRKRLSAIFARGYYTRTTLIAYDRNGHKRASATRGRPGRRVRRSQATRGQK
ncbi:hypothetical protein [Nonomuraea rubra]|uniref:rhamnogalacturonan lyase family protein n=1 Tax=Nonomuraea rubra TaxID=46180 RepID=UPI0036152081